MRRLLILTVVVLLAHAAAATPPATIGYQGRLLGSDGNPVANGIYTVTFRIYDAELDGTLLWTEMQDLSVDDGIFDAILGEFEPLMLAFDEPYWLSTQIGGDPELVPRTELASVPYAMRALYAELTLPYSGAVTDPGPAFEVQNNDGPSIVGRSDLDVPDSYALVSRSTTGEVWGALGYRAGSGTTWGIYTPLDLYVYGDIVQGMGDAYLPMVHTNALQLQTTPTEGYVLTSDASGYGTWQPPSEFTLPYAGTTSATGAAFEVWNENESGINGRSYLTPPLSYGVRGGYALGRPWGALGYHDDTGNVWGVYTLDDSYVGGTLVLPEGAATGYVLSSDSWGHASWEPPADEFALPYSDTICESGPAFEVSNSCGSGINGLTYFASPISYAVRGGDAWGNIWAALAYQDDIERDVWGVYTNSNVYIGGSILEYPSGAVDGYVLTSDSGGRASWQEAPGFTLPYSGSLSSYDSLFDIVNVGTGPAASFATMGGGGVVEVFQHGMPSDYALRFSSDSALARISGGTSSSHEDIVIKHASGQVGIGLVPSAELHVDGTVRAEDVMLTSGAAQSLVLVSNGAGEGYWAQVDVGGLADPLDFTSQTWDWDFSTGRLDIDKTGDGNLLDLTNSSASGSGGVVLIRSTSTAVTPASTQALRVTSQKGNAGSFKKYTHDGYSAVDIFADTSTGLGLYVSGTITSTAYSARGVGTSRGTEAVFGVETPEPEIYDSGEAFLAGGRARVSFDRLFTEAIAGDARVRVTVTPIGGWSALYIESTDTDGFVVRSADGDPDIEFFWTACGLGKDHEVAQQITFHDTD